MKYKGEDLLAGKPINNGNNKAYKWKQWPIWKVINNDKICEEWHVIILMSDMTIDTSTSGQMELVMQIYSILWLWGALRENLPILYSIQYWQPM